MRVDMRAAGQGVICNLQKELLRRACRGSRAERRRQGQGARRAPRREGRDPHRTAARRDQGPLTARPAGRPRLSASSPLTARHKGQCGLRCTHACAPAEPRDWPDGHLFRPPLAAADGTMMRALRAALTVSTGVRILTRFHRPLPSIYSSVSSSVSRNIVGTASTTSSRSCDR